MSSISPDKLSKEFLETYARTQVEIYLSTEPSDEKLAWAEIKKAYKVAKLPEPKNIIWYDSPQQFTASVRASVRASVGDSVWDSVRASVGASVGDSVWDSVWDSVRAWQDAPYNAWLKFLNDHQEQNDFRHMCYFSEQVTGYLLTADTVHAVRKPKRLVRNPEGRLHYDHGKAIEWNDGYGFYYLNGVEFDEPIFKKIVDQKFTLTDLGSGDLSAEQRAVAVSMLRPDLLLKQVGAKLVNTGKKGTRLYRVDNFMDTGETEYCMRMTHPSIKNIEYIEWVEPDLGKLEDADLCQAKAFGMTKRQYLEALEA